MNLDIGSSVMQTSPTSPSNIGPVPQGFKTYVTNVGVKDNTNDFVCIFSEAPCSAAGVFTQSRFAGPSVKISREHIANGEARAIITISKNANVATGPEGESDAKEIVASIAAALNIPPKEVLIASTGVIGRRYPMERIMPYVHKVANNLTQADFAAAANGIMTTDTRPKLQSISIGNASLVGIAKGVGMIEPNMATLLTYFLTDAEIDKATLDSIFRRVMNRTFNCLSIDTDTSTSDTALILANGLAGPVDIPAFETALETIATNLVKSIASDGEGATKVIEVTVDHARDYAQAKRVAKSVVNSPLVKTAIHGSDPNWGRIAMAIGKCDSDTDIFPEKTRIYISGKEVYPQQLTNAELLKLTELLKREEISIYISLGIGHEKATVWGCDLSEQYVDINASYTT